MVLRFVFLFHTTHAWDRHIIILSAFQLSRRTCSKQRRMSPACSSRTAFFIIFCNYSTIVRWNLLRRIFVEKRNKCIWMKECCFFVKKLFMNAIGVVQDYDCLPYTSKSEYRMTEIRRQIRVQATSVYAECCSQRPLFTVTSLIFLFTKFFRYFVVCLNRISTYY
jgi:hypothetical protein